MRGLARVATKDELPGGIAGAGVSNGLRLWALRAVVVAALLAVWGLVPAFGLQKFFVSDPISVFGRLFADVQTPPFWAHIQTTVSEIILGVVLGASSGAVLGLLLGFAPAVYRVLEPILLALYAMPRVALAPLFVIYFGIDIPSKVALVVTIVIFIMLLNTYVGVRNTDRDLIDSVRTMGGTRLFVVRRVILPSAVPLILTGLRLSVVYGIAGAVVGEMLIARRGLGTLLSTSANNFDTTGVFEVLMITALLGFLANELLSAVERRVADWSQ